MLVGAQLEAIKASKAHLLQYTAVDHINIMRRNKKDPSSVRPDITHKSLLMLFDLPLNHAVLLQGYIHAHKNVLNEINPQYRILRTFKRSGGSMSNMRIELFAFANWRDL